MALFDPETQAGNMQGTYVEPNVDDSLSALFREIGTTLKDVTKQGFTKVQDTVKTALAEKIMSSPQGQAQIAAYKMDYLLKYLPWVALAAIALFIGGRYFSRS
jgi:hypothetical protein